MRHIKRGVHPYRLSDADLNGRLDESKVFDRALTAAEVKAEYDATK